MSEPDPLGEAFKRWDRKVATTGDVIFAFAAIPVVVLLVVAVIIIVERVT